MVTFILFVLGLCAGSFSGAVVWRLHEQDKSKKQSRDKRFSISRGRSMCEHCHHTLSAIDLIPLVSWLSLRGKCRYCRKPIGWEAPLLELVTGLLFAGSFWFWPVNVSGSEVIYLSLWLLMLIVLVILALYDLKWFLLPNRVVAWLGGLAMLQVIIKMADKGFVAFTGALWGVLIAGGLFYVLFQISRGKWIGGGDVKLGAVLGLLLGSPSLSLFMLFSASLLGSLVSTPLLIAKKATRKTLLPFGPFLILATIITQLFGAAVIAWYKRHFLLEM